MYFFGLPANNIDRLFVRLEQGLSSTEINSATGLPIDTIEKITTYYNSAFYTRRAPLMPKI